MGKASFRPVRKGMSALGQSPQVGALSVQAARNGKRYAESIAPVGPTSNYKNSFRVRPTQVRVPGRYGGRRAGAVLENTAPHAHLVEWHNQSLVLTRTAAHMEQQR